VAQPVVVIVDDLHWSDRPTLLLLEFMARELANSRILLVGTYRDVELNRRHPLALTLGDLTRERLFERVLLRGLSKEDVGKFIEVAAGLKPPQGLVDAVHTQTEGNPLFVTEVVRLLVQEGHLSPDKLNEDPEGRRSTRGHGKTTTWIVRVPEGVREVIGRRLDRLSERCNGVLTIAAVIGRQFSLQQLLAVLNDSSASPDERVSEDRLFEHLEEALAGRVIEELPKSVGLYQFTHALIQETLTNELSTTHRVRLHGRIARSLESFYGSHAASHAEELAYHFGEAETLHGAAPLIKYSLIAGERALSSYAPHEAERYFSSTTTLSMLQCGVMGGMMPLGRSGAARAAERALSARPRLRSFRGSILRSSRRTRS
jgi:predicted ATPase